jgi:hypothetical protein
MQPRYSLEEHARLGDEVYQRDVKPHVEPRFNGRVVAVDIETGAFEVADDGVTAAQRLLARLPQAQPWLVRAGVGPLHQLGPLTI